MSPNQTIGFVVLTRKSPSFAWSGSCDSFHLLCLIPADDFNPLEDDDDERYNGWVVGLVVHPLVSGLGNSDGSDYTTQRVWVKAQVWLEESETETQGHDDDGGPGQQDDEVDMIKLWPKPDKRIYGRGNQRKGVEHFQCCSTCTE